MRVSSFSRGSVIAISAFAAIFLATMYKVGDSLTSSRAQYNEYQQLKSLTSVKFNRTVGQYLRTGDASLLNEAEAMLDDIIKHAKLLGITSLTDAIKLQATQLKGDIKTKYRAMGKLSGDPLALLRNGEREIAAINKDLAKYAGQSAELNDQQRVQYLLLTSQVAKALADLVDARETMFARQQLGSDSLNLAVRELTSLSRQFDTFPELAIFLASEDDEDDFFNDEDDKEDISAEALSDLQSLINRYQGELNNTLKEYR